MVRILRIFWNFFSKFFLIYRGDFSGFYQSLLKLKNEQNFIFLTHYNAIINFLSQTNSQLDPEGAPGVNLKSQKRFFERNCLWENHEKILPKRTGSPKIDKFLLGVI